MDLKSDLKAFIKAHLLSESADVEDIEDNRSLIEMGIIDSMGLLQIMDFIDEKTGIRIPDDEVLPDNFQTLNSIEAMVQRLDKPKS